MKTKFSHLFLMGMGFAAILTATSMLLRAGEGEMSLSALWKSSAKTYVDSLTPDSCLSMRDRLEMREKQLAEQSRKIPAIHSMNRAAGVSSVPYFEGFDTRESFNTCLVLDKNADGSTWTWDGGYDGNPYARYSYSSTNDADDWLLTPLIYLDGNSTYVLSFKYRRGYNPERLAVAFGMGDDPANFTVLDAGFDIPDGEYKTFTKEVKPAASGNYRFGLHAISPANTFYIAVDDISVTAGSHVLAPDSVKSFTVAHDAQGMLKAAVSMVTPQVDGNGNAITALSKIELLRNDTLIHTFISPATGEQLTFEAVGGVHGMNTFKAVAYNENGAGRKAENSVFLGLDTPVAPTHVRLIDNGTNVTVMWDGVTSAQGVHGGFVDVAKITYNVYNTYQAKIGEGISEHELLDDDTETAGKNRLLQYAVSAQNETGESDLEQSNWLTAGNPWQLPVHDSFFMGVFETSGWWVPVFVKPHWHCTTSVSYDNDRGSVCLEKDTTVAGRTANLNTAKISVVSAKKPYLTFAYYVKPGIDNQLKVIASKLQKDSITLASIDFKATDLSEGWHKMSLSLDQLKNTPNFVISFQGTTNDDDVPVVIDDVDFWEMKDNDLMVAIMAPESVKMNTPVEVKVRVSNNGSTSQSDYSVDFYEGDRLVETKKGPSIESSGEAIIEFSYPTTVQSLEMLHFHAKVNCELDEVPSNNVTDTVQVEVVKNDYFPGVTDLSGTAGKNGKTIDLVWSAPVLSEEVTDDFETYKPWSIQHVGPWTFIDMDNAPTVTINGYDFKHAGEPFAYIVFDPETTNPPLDVTVDTMTAAHSGHQYLASFAVDVEQAKGVGNDDALLSPQLNGDAQTVSFWARSLFDEYKEAFEVIAISIDQVSGQLSGDTVLVVNEVPAQWTQYSAEIPAGYQYFAIRCVSVDKFMFQLDDITYRPKLMTVNGYNIYRDSTLVGNVKVPAYSDAAPGEGAHTYQVTVLYNEGESGLSNACTVNASAVNSLHRQALDVLGHRGYIRIAYAGGQVVEVYNVNGQLVAKQAVNGETNLPASPGVYIVRLGHEAKRVVVL